MINDTLGNKTATEKANLKSAEIVKVATGQRQRSDYKIEIVSSNTIEGGVEVFIRAWDSNNNQIGFGDDGSVDIERIVIKNPPILVSDPNGTIIRTGKIDGDGDDYTLKYREDPEEALLQSLEHTLKVKKQKFSADKIVPGRVGNTTLTAYPNTGTGTAPMDSQVGEGGEDTSFSTLRGAAGDTNNYNVDIVSHGRLLATATTDQYSTMARTSAGFDTSSIGSDVISSATVSLYMTGKATALDSTDLDLVSHAPADEANIAASDYAIAKFGSTRLATGIDISGMTTSAYEDWSLNASGISHISTGGNTYFGWLLKWDLDNSFTGTWSSGAETRAIGNLADQTGTSQDPKLVVEHTPFLPQVIIT